MNLKVTHTQPADWPAATALACRFIVDYPGNFGWRDGCAYSRPGAPTFYVYRTKTAIVVRGQEE